MLRNLFRNKTVQNTRKFYKPNYKLHNTNIQKNKRTILFEEEPQRNFIKMQGKYKFLKDKLMIEERKVKKQIKNKKKLRKTKGFDLNEIKKFADNVQFDKSINMILGVGFEYDIQAIRNQKEYIKPDFLKFGENFTQLTEQLGSLSDNELIQFLRHSVALKASPDFENQAKSILLKQSIKEEIDKRFENEAEFNKALPSLIKKLAMKIVYGKVDEILKQKNDGSSYEHNDVIKMLLEDPYINPNSFFAQDLLTKIYSQGDKVFTFNESEDQLSDKNLYEQHFQQNYLTARIQIMCSLADIDINRQILIPETEVQEIHSQQELLNREQQEFKQLTLSLKDILADYTMHNNLNNSIKNLERQLNIYQKEFPSLEKIAVHLNQAFANIPQIIQKKYFDKNHDAEDQSKYINENYKQEQIQWNTVNMEIPCEVMKIEQQLDEQERKNKMVKIEGVQRSYTYYHCANPIVYHQDAEDEFYENSDQELDEDTTNAWFDAELEFNHREFDHQINRTLYEFNRSYLNEMEKKLYLARNPKSKNQEYDEPLHFSELPEEYHQGDKYVYKDDNLNKTNKLSYAFLDTNLIKKEFDDREFRQVNYFNFLTKRNYDRLFDSKNLQAIRSVLGRDVHGSKLHKYLFYNSKWYIGTKIRVRGNNYQCFDQDEKNEYNEELDLEQDPTLSTPEAYNDFLQVKYNKYRTIPKKSILDTDLKLFKSVEQKKPDDTFETQPFYQQLVTYYKQANRSYFYNHYIQTALKEYQLFSREQKMDILEQEIDPNYGFYNVKGGISEYSEEFIKSQSDPNQIISKLNPKLQGKEQNLDDLRQLYPNLFEIKEPQKKQDQKTIQIFSCQGSRKRARATAVLKIPGTGKVKVNNRQFTEYFFRGDDRFHILKPIALINKVMEVDIEFFVHGGNLGTQSEAGKLALARSICKAYPEFTNHFKSLHFLYRDPRTKERKKISSYGARKSYTYVRR